MRLGVLTGGGDAAGLNAAVRAIVRRALISGDSVVGIRDGWAGLTGEGNLMTLDRHAVTGILPLGGTILGSSRTDPRKVEGGRERLLENISRFGLDAVAVIGGEDTLGVAAWLHEQGVRVGGVPKTIDNDLAVTDFCIGFDSAVAVVSEALDRLHTTTASHHRVMVVEVMGRNTGWLAVSGGLAGGADMVLIPEFPVVLGDIVDHVAARRREERGFSILAVSEGVHIAELAEDDGEGDGLDAFGHPRLSRRDLGERLASLLQERTGVEARATVLGHLQRGGSPTAYDRVWATAVGSAAYDLLAGGESGSMPVVRGGRVEHAPIREVVAQRRTVPRELYELTKSFQ